METDVHIIQAVRSALIFLELNHSHLKVIYKWSWASKQMRRNIIPDNIISNTISNIILTLGDLSESALILLEIVFFFLYFLSLTKHP